MNNKTKQTAVDSIIEFCQKQMDKDSSIHKGVYLSIIKFCQEQITKESEIHWKTTLVTTKPIYWTNNKQQTAVEWLINDILKHDKSFLEFYKAEIEQAKEMEKSQHEKTYNQSLMSNYKTFEDFYEQTYGGNK
jgi:hypothetical protein